MRLYLEGLDLNLEGLEVLDGNNTSTSIHCQLHRTNFLVNILHELDDEINQLMLVELLSVEVRDEEANIVAFDGLPPQNDKVLRSLVQEVHELLAQNAVRVVRLFHLNRDTNGVHRRFNVNHLLVVPGDGDRSAQKLGAGLRLHLRLVVSFDNLGGEVLKTDGRRQGRPDAVEVWLVGHVCLFYGLGVCFDNANANDPPIFSVQTM
mmetsp:Transcript_22210/g.62411  ORF Transcript_22210/g.62411 Transcript_22210/m.62411 type:complete len:206 (+) Transcript_22210:23-640(+)